LSLLHLNRYFYRFYLEPGLEPDEIRGIIAHTKPPYDISYYYRDPGDPHAYEISSDELPYEALSYVCGPETPRRSITIIDKNDLTKKNNFFVRNNLWLALRQLRLKFHLRVLWIDAICIDQWNPDERNHQVALMGMIYNRAWQAIVWLGCSDEVREKAFDTLKPNEWAGLFHPSDDSIMIIEGNRKLKAVYPLLAQEYWKRLWIIQEFLMARDFLIQCGSKSCTKFGITYFMSSIDSIHPVIPETEATFVKFGNPS
jgi:hypothetical protein